MSFPLVKLSARSSAAKSEYQELIRELHSLDTALRSLDRLEREVSDSRSVDSIKYAAMNCRHTLEEFLMTIKGYDKSLGIRSRSHPVRATADKLRWTFSQKEDIARLQAHLSLHIGNINIMLTKHGLEKMDKNNENVEAHALQVGQQLDHASGLLQAIKQDMPTQALVLRNDTQHWVACIVYWSEK